MRVLEFVIAGVFGVLGIRSVVHWASRPFDSDDPVDHALYAVYVTGRAGIWFALGGLFLVFGLSGAEGRASLAHTARDLRWYVVIFAVLGVLQLLGGWFLGRRGSDRENEAEDAGGGR